MKHVHLYCFLVVVYVQCCVVSVHEKSLTFVLFPSSGLCTVLCVVFVYICIVALPEAFVQQNPAIVMVTTKRGGHIGFMEGVWPFHKTWMDRFIVQLLKMQRDLPVLTHKHNAT